MPFPRRRFADSSFAIAIAMDSTGFRFDSMSFGSSMFLSWIVVLGCPTRLYERRRLGSSGRTACQLNVETTWFQKDLAIVQDTIRHGMCECLRLLNLIRQYLTQILRESPELLDFSLLFGCDEIVVRLI
uniref:Uncharacterized protein n=1 Tax=Cucumis melo TaxID=3656 RepID=A0A9I9EF15_CUCME